MTTDDDREDYALLADMALQQCSRREVRWICPYCTKEVEDEYSACCGERQAQPQPDEYLDL